MIQLPVISRDSRIGIVGVGRMGANMAHRLKDCGYPITGVYDVVPQVAQAVSEALQCPRVSSLAALTAASDVVITVVTDDAAMRAIYTHPSDNLLMNAAGTLFLNCATITPQVHVDCMTLAHAAGAFMLECPMASSIPQARSGQLCLMVAGDSATYEAALPLLHDLATDITFVGGPGQAAQLKALVNMVMNMNTAALAEGLGLADALGLDLSLVREVFAKTGANSRVLQTDAEDMQVRDHAVYFSASHAAKDSYIALALGQSVGLPMVLADATARQFDAVVAEGLGELDKSAIAELCFLERRADHSPVLPADAGCVAV